MPIDLHFGNPTNETIWQNIESISDSKNINIEASVIEEFKHIINTLFYENTKDNFFEVYLLGFHGISIEMPKICNGSYTHNGFTLPKIRIHDTSGIDKTTKEKIFLTDELINSIGNMIQDEFTYTYYGFKRL